MQFDEAQTLQTATVSATHDEVYARALEEIRPDTRHIETENNDPVDNFFSEKQMRLLTETLYASWQREKPFLAMANVGLFWAVRKPGIVPDMMLSLDVEPEADWFQKENRSYFVWEFGKLPEVVMEIVSNFKGEELGTKLDKYAAAGVPYYAVYDPALHYGEPSVRLFALQNMEYLPMQDNVFTHVGLGLVLWQGVFEGRMDTWLRWCYPDGTVIPTGRERAETEKQRAEVEKQRAETAEANVAALVAQLQALGITPYLKEV
jgi:Uma2 family endonuclease